MSPRKMSLFCLVKDKQAAPQISTRPEESSTDLHRQEELCNTGPGCTFHPLLTVLRSICHVQKVLESDSPAPASYSRLITVSEGGCQGEDSRSRGAQQQPVSEETLMKIYLQQQESRRCCWLKGNRQGAESAHPGGSISLKAPGWRQTDGAPGWSTRMELQGGAPGWSTMVEHHGGAPGRRGGHCSTTQSTAENHCPHSGGEHFLNGFCP